MWELRINHLNLHTYGEKYEECANNLIIKHL